MPLDIANPVCPHDCPPTCARDVERRDSRRVGRVHDAYGDGQTAGVVGAKAARYAGHRHHLQWHGPESVWPNFHAGTMGLVQRDKIERLRHGPPEGGGTFHDTAARARPA